ncbi:MGS207 protein [Colletotrichum orchidophilum]|uniref:MGS207 protein n=1 Tax=Colletotrichum orchidophilum TaxID=1209926 RepID=A0A1G4ANW4_9PEZI|nr:MGS207 protein [Colletotrichum orchidophilum]OHE90878.1 MGS207 protein [Colletotrichum orchidophilum]
MRRSPHLNGGSSSGKWPYTAAYSAFFDDKVAKCRDDWMKVVDDHIFARSQPIIDGFSGGLGYPFIHLPYALEVDDKQVATEALSMGCTEYDPTHEIPDLPPPDNELLTRL